MAALEGSSSSEEGESQCVVISKPGICGGGVVVLVGEAVLRGDEGE